MSTKGQRFFLLDMAKCFTVWNAREGYVPAVDEFDEEDGAAWEYCAVRNDHPGYKPYGEPIAALRVRAKKLDSVAYTPERRIVTDDRARHILEASGFTGFHFKNADVGESRIKPRPTLNWLVIDGWGGVASADSGIEYRGTPCPSCAYVKYPWKPGGTRFVDPTQWDGSDFFIVWPAPKFVFTTSRVKELAEANGISGMVFLDEMEIYSDLFEKYGAGPHAPKSVFPSHLLERREDQIAKVIESRCEVRSKTGE